MFDTLEETAKNEEQLETQEFESINTGYNNTFHPNKLSLGLVIPVENHGNELIPSMDRHIERAQLAEALGFSALWLRDVPFYIPSFGDVGQIYDPFVYLGVLAAQTKRIALGTASIVLPLRHPAHVAKAVASVDVLSGGRLILGVASGDRPEEYPALNMSFSNRGNNFRSSFEYIRQLWEDTPTFENSYGNLNVENRHLNSMDMLPKPSAGKIPMLITGASQQAPDWIAQNGEGWITYPRKIETQASIIRKWRTGIKAAGLPNKPAVQSLYIDLQDDPNAPTQPIHLGFSCGINPLRDYLASLQTIGINHVALNLRLNKADIETTLRRLSDELLPEFS